MNKAFKIGQRVRLIEGPRDDRYEIPTEDLKYVGAYGVVEDLPITDLLDEERQGVRMDDGTKLHPLMECIVPIDDEDGKADWREVEQMLPWKRPVAA